MLPKKIQTIGSLHGFGAGQNSHKTHLARFLDNGTQILSVQTGGFIEVERDGHLLATQKTLEQQQVDQHFNGDGGAVGFDGIQMGITSGFAVDTCDFKMQIKEISQFDAAVPAEKIA